jgi:protein-S-isoprenylcysteine O-methyltransferase Ste14
MMLAKLTWPVAVVLVVAILVVAGVFVGLPVWAIKNHWMAPELLFGPLGTILITASTGFGLYVKGQNEVPTWMSDPKVQRVMSSMAPPPMISASLAPPSMPKDVEAWEVKVKEGQP